MLQGNNNLDNAGCVYVNKQQIMSNINLPEMHESYSCHMHGKTYKKECQKTRKPISICCQIQWKQNTPKPTSNAMAILLPSLNLHRKFIF